MKSFWPYLVLAICSGSSLGWAINYRRFGHRDASFGPFNLGHEVTAENAMELRDAKAPDLLGRVNLPAGSDHDFGVMPPGQKGEHVFVVKNVGQGELNLRIGASSCKCTIGSLNAETVPPGGQTEVKLEWNIESNFSEVDFAQTAQLLTNDPEQYAITLNVSGKVIGDVAVVPDKWSFGEVASGEPFVVTGKCFSFYDESMTVDQPRFSDDTMNEFAEFEVEPFTPSEADGIYATAKQAFRVTAKVRGGLRQGAIQQTLLIPFQLIDDDENPIDADSEAEEKFRYIVPSVTGRIVGALGMIANARIDGAEGGGYIYNFGRLDDDDDLVGKCYVMLKGSEMDNTTLSIGEVNPASVLKARLGEPTGRGSMVLYPLEIEIIPGEKTVSRMGKNRDDYGNVWIESDNPKVTKMRIAVKFSVDPR